MIIYQSIIGGGPALGGDPFGHETSNFWDIKLQIFGAEGAENFENLEFLMKNRLFFGVLRENLAKF